jgi:hypothetical protein
MNEDTPSGEERQAETARLLSVDPDELDYIGDELDGEIGEPPGDEAPPSDEEVPEIEVAAAEARGLVVPNRISYGVWFQWAGTNGRQNVYKYVRILDGVCARDTFWTYLWEVAYNRSPQDGWCRRPQTDAYDRRYKIYWRA